MKTNHLFSSRPTESEKRNKGQDSVNIHDEELEYSRSIILGPWLEYGCVELTVSMQHVLGREENHQFAQWEAQLSNLIFRNHSLQLMPEFNKKTSDTWKDNLLV